MWDFASTMFALNANGPVYTVFGAQKIRLNEGGSLVSTLSMTVGSKSTWHLIEYPILHSNKNLWTPIRTGFGLK